LVRPSIRDFGSDDDEEVEERRQQEVELRQQQQLQQQLQKAEERKRLQYFFFPPHINMLKFGGSPCLLSGLQYFSGKVGNIDYRNIATLKKLTSKF